MRDDDPLNQKVDCLVSDNRVKPLDFHCDACDQQTHMDKSFNTYPLCEECYGSSNIFHLESVFDIRLSDKPGLIVANYPKEQVNHSDIYVRMIIGLIREVDYMELEIESIGRIAKRDIPKYHAIANIDKEIETTIAAVFKMNTHIKRIFEILCNIKFDRTFHMYIDRIDNIRQDMFSVKEYVLKRLANLIALSIKKGDKVEITLDMYDLSKVRHFLERSKSVVRTIHSGASD
jgi:hypothetical protein